MSSGDATVFSNLFSSISVGEKTLSNRAALVATVTNYARANRITERWIDFLVERARGGTGMVITEVIAVDPDARAQGSTVTGYDDDNIEGFQRAARETQEAGARLLGQLWHPGRQQLWLPGASPKGVSDQPDAYSWTVPHVMTEPELERVVEAYVKVAERLHQCGFDGVELHGAHGYLITQVLSPWSNTRNDRYGGSTERRAKFVRDIAEGIRKRCGKDFILGIKLPGDEGVVGGIDVEEASRITSHLAETGNFDYFAYNQGNFSLSLEQHVPDVYFSPGHFIDLHKQIRPYAKGVPVMAVGRINTPELAERILAEGYADFVGMSRALIADAAFMAKAGLGRSSEIRPSVFDNQSWGEIHVGKPLEEPQNPRLGLKGDADWTPEPASKPLKVVVVGSGPSGLEAAWVAAARGHRVTLLSAGSAIGGHFRDEAGLPDRREFSLLLDHYRMLLERHGVDLRLSTRVSAEDVQALEPDHVVLATGAKQRRPEGVEDSGAAISGQHAMAMLSEGTGPAGREGVVAVYDHDHSAATYALVDELAKTASRIMLLTPRTYLARTVNYCSAIGVHRRLYAAGVEIIHAATVERFEAKSLVWTNPYTGVQSSAEGVDLFVYSTLRRADDTLAAPLRNAGIEVSLIGDCMSPRNQIGAIHEGHAVGNAL
ncbi:oxidoreductase [Roseovarius nitratireducens]|uniref:oxidoreductase n=1 Tax=Roseovarius nitratireducens TaxID=2044597 RepID=UPI000CE1975C|nr:FAD-dependent oxidoreductase [Roseovarius nitratireducens]